MSPLLVGALLVGPLAAAAASRDGASCGTTPGLRKTLLEFHADNSGRIAAAGYARRLGGGLGDRIEDDLLIIEDAGDLGGASLVEAALDDLVVIAAPGGDPDHDGLAGAQDNCPATFNPGQEDFDADATGDACDCAPADPGVSAVPGVVGHSLVLGGPDLLDWQPIPQAVAYNLYRGLLEAVDQAGFRPACRAASLPDPQFTDPDQPSPGATYHYVVTGRNCFGEGAAGADSQGWPWALPAACP